MFNRDQMISLFHIRKQSGNLFASLPQNIFERFAELYDVNKEAGVLAEKFYNELFDIADCYRKQISYGSRFAPQSSGLYFLLRSICRENNFDNIKKLLLLIQLAQELYSYLSTNESKIFKSLVDDFMIENCLHVKNHSSLLLPSVMDALPYGMHNFYNYFLGGCHMLHNPKIYFSNICARYDRYVRDDLTYTYNKQSYTLLQLVQKYIIVKFNLNEAKQRKMNKKPRAWDELDDPESAIGMHNVL